MGRRRARRRRPRGVGRGAGLPGRRGVRDWPWCFRSWECPSGVNGLEPNAIRTRNRGHRIICDPSTIPGEVSEPMCLGLPPTGTKKDGPHPGQGCGPVPIAWTWCHPLRVYLWHLWPIAAPASRREVLYAPSGSTVQRRRGMNCIWDRDSRACKVPNKRAGGSRVPWGGKRFSYSSRDTTSAHTIDRLSRWVCARHPSERNRHGCCSHRGCEQFLEHALPSLSIWCRDASAAVNTIAALATSLHLLHDQFIALCPVGFRPGRRFGRAPSRLPGRRCRPACGCRGAACG